MTTSIYRPHPGPQTDFLSCPDDVALFGGGAGSGGTTALLLDWARHINTPGVTGLLIRARLSDVTTGAWPEAAAFFAGTGGTARTGPVPSLTWPSGARLMFGHDAADLISRWSGVGLSWIGVDHAEACDVDRIAELFLRCRPAPGWAKPRLRLSAVADHACPLAKWVASGRAYGDLSFRFYPATVKDNPSLADTNYPRMLAMSEDVTRLLHGQWEARA